MTCGGVRVVEPQHPLRDGQGAFTKRPGGRWLALVVEQEGQVVEACGGVAAVGRQLPRLDGQSALV